MLPIVENIPVHMPYIVLPNTNIGSQGYEMVQAILTNKSILT